jgi:hypothetical protein
MRRVYCDHFKLDGQPLPAGPAGGASPVPSGPGESPIGAQPHERAAGQGRLYRPDEQLSDEQMGEPTSLVRR